MQRKLTEKQIDDLVDVALPTAFWSLVMLILDPTQVVHIDKARKAIRIFREVAVPDHPKDQTIDPVDLIAAMQGLLREALTQPTTPLSVIKAEIVSSPQAVIKTTEYTLSKDGKKQLNTQKAR